MPLDVPAQATLDRLPFASHPGVLIRLLDELGGAEAIGDEASRLFLLDPALAMLALEALVRSDPGLDLTGLDFPDRMARLDPGPLKARVTAAATAQLGQPGPPAANLELAWRKSLACAHFARALAERGGYPGRDEAWRTGPGPGPLATPGGCGGGTGAGSRPGGGAAGGPSGGPGRSGSPALPAPRAGNRGPGEHCPGQPPGAAHRHRPRKQHHGRGLGPAHPGPGGGDPGPT